MLMASHNYIFLRFSFWSVGQFLNLIISYVNKSDEGEMVL